jgi:hypothetical protein
VLDRPNKYGAYCEQIPVPTPTSPVPTPSPPPPKTCPGGYYLDVETNQCIETVK